MILQYKFFAKAIQICLIVLFILLQSGCDKDDSNGIVTTDNHSPEISSISATPSKLGYGDNSTISVNAKDQDNDNLTYRWSCSEGSYTTSVTSETVTWKAPDQEGTCKLEVTVSDGEDSTTSSVDIKVMGLFFDEFATDLDDWETSYCNSWITSEEAHAEGDVSGYYGTLYHKLSPSIEPEYTVQMKLASVDNFDSDEFYGLYTRVDDSGSITITSWWFIIEPSASGENWALICFVSSSSSSAWVLLEQNSYGESSLINTSSNAWNDVSWTIEQDKKVIVRLGNQLLYQSDEISNLENTFGITITMDLTRAGCRTFYHKEVKIDDALVKNTSQPSNKFSVKRKFPKETIETQIENTVIQIEVTELKTLREVLSDWY